MENEDEINRDERGCAAARAMWDIYIDLAQIDKTAAKTAAMTFMSLIFNGMEMEERLGAIYHLNMTAEMFQCSESTEEFVKKIKENQR